MGLAKYLVNHSYSAQIDETRVSLAEGEEVGIESTLAERINADSPGTLTLVSEFVPRVNRMLTNEHVFTRGVQVITEPDEMPHHTPPATPAARVLAESLGLDLSGIPFAGDQITVKDVQTAAGGTAVAESVQPQAGFGATKSGTVYLGAADSTPGKKVK